MEDNEKTFYAINFQFSDLNEWKKSYVIGPKVFGPSQGITQYKDIVMTWGDKEYEKTWKEFLIFMGVPEKEVNEILTIKSEELEINCYSCSVDCGGHHE